MADMFRVTLTRRAGQFANEACFQSWLATTPGVFFVDGIANPGNANEIYYVWRQATEVKFPAASVCDIALVTSGGKNGWEKEIDARQVILHALGQAAAVDAQVAKANAAAVAPGKIAGDAAAELAGDVAAGAKKAASSEVVGTALLFGIGGVIAYGAWKVFGRKSR
jgi:hypothetical protein